MGIDGLQGPHELLILMTTQTILHIIIPGMCIL
jgi:hypothetical protein